MALGSARHSAHCNWSCWAWNSPPYLESESVHHVRPVELALPQRYWILLSTLWLHWFYWAFLWWFMVCKPYMAQTKLHFPSSCSSWRSRPPLGGCSSDYSKKSEGIQLHRQEYLPSSRDLPQDPSLCIYLYKYMQFWSSKLWTLLTRIPQGYQIFIKL